MPLEIVYKEKRRDIPSLFFNHTPSYFSKSYPRSAEPRFEYCGYLHCCWCHSMFEYLDKEVDHLPVSSALLYKSMAFLEKKLECCGCLDSGLM